MENIEKAYQYYNEADITNKNDFRLEKALSLLLLPFNSETELKVLQLRWHIYYLKGAYTKALNDLNRYLSQEPTARNMYYNRGIVHFMLKKNVAAFNDFTEVSRLAGLCNDDDLLDATEHHLIELKKLGY